MRRWLATAALLLAACDDAEAPINPGTRPRKEEPIPAGLAQANVEQVAVDPADSSTLYAVETGSLSKSIDGGMTWKRLGEGLPRGHRVTAVAIDPRTPSTVYVGAADADGRGFIHKSTDGGASWSATGAGTSIGAVTALAMDPSNLYAATDPEFFQASLHASSDGGKTWRVLDLTDLTILALVIDPSSPTSIYAATSGGEVAGTVDGGKTWRHSAVRANSPFELHSLAVEGRTLYAGASSNLYKSEDAGATWSVVKTIPYDAFTALAVSPRAVYAGTDGGGVFESTDGGRTWKELSGGPPKTRIASLVLSPSKLFAGTSGAGVWIVPTRENP